MYQNVEGKIPFTLILPARQRTRLSGTCFREGVGQVAGNFCTWRSLEDLFDEKSLWTKFVEQAVNSIVEVRESDEPRTGQFAVTITLRHMVGWVSTAPIGRLPPETATEQFEPNRWTRAHRVADRSLLAPLTNKVTFVFSITRDIKRWVVIIHSVYPGEEVELGSGALHEIAPEEAVFFDWQHPGQPLPV